MYIYVNTITQYTIMHSIYVYIMHSIYVYICIYIYIYICQYHYIVHNNTNAQYCMIVQTMDAQQLYELHFTTQLTTIIFCMIILQYCMMTVLDTLLNTHRRNESNGGCTAAVLIIQYCTINDYYILHDGWCSKIGALGVTFQ